MLICMFPMQNCFFGTKKSLFGTAKMVVKIIVISNSLLISLGYIGNVPNVLSGDAFCKRRCSLSRSVLSGTKSNERMKLQLLSV